MAGYVFVGREDALHDQAAVMRFAAGDFVRDGVVAVRPCEVYYLQRKYRMAIITLHRIYHELTWRS